MVNNISMLYEMHVPRRSLEAQDLERIGDLAKGIGRGKEAVRSAYQNIAVTVRLENMSYWVNLFGMEESLAGAAERFISHAGTPQFVRGDYETLDTVLSKYDKKTQSTPGPPGRYVVDS